MTKKKKEIFEFTLTAALCSLKCHNGLVREWHLSLPLSPGGKSDEKPPIRLLSVTFVPPFEYHWWKSHTQTVLSLLPLAKYRPLGHHLRPQSSWRWCWNLIIHSFWRTSYKRISPVLRVPLKRKFIKLSLSFLIFFLKSKYINNLQK
jgi:hypothetical protein